MVQGLLLHRSDQTRCIRLISQVFLDQGSHPFLIVIPGTKMRVHFEIPIRGRRQCLLDCVPLRFDVISGLSDIGQEDEHQDEEET